MRDADLHQVRQPIFYKDGTNVDLQNIAQLLQAGFAKYNVPVAFEFDKVKAGGLLKSTTTDCLVLYHPEHKKDYVNFVIRLSNQGTMTFVNVDSFGSSKQMKKQIEYETNREQRRGQDVGSQLANILTTNLMTLGRSKSKLEEEKNYYKTCHAVMDEVFA